MVGRRLRKFKRQHGSDILADNKKLGGIGRLNEKWISKLQNYYDLATRKNTHILFLMRKAVGQSFTTAAKRISVKLVICFLDPDLPVAVRYAIKHQDLSSPELVEKCLHGKT